ncbi:hypothetical protein MTO96_028814 [Rhipicephalus appendiculatus]
MRSPMTNAEVTELTESSTSDAEAGDSDVSSAFNATDLGTADVDDGICNTACPTCGHRITETASKFSQVYIPNASANKGTMTAGLLKSSAVQTEESSFPSTHPRSSTPVMDYAPQLDISVASECSDMASDEDDEIIQHADVNEADSTFAVSEASNPEEPVSEDAVSEAKYLVFDSCLMALFERCRSCQAVCRVQKETDGSLLRITATCPLQHVWSWESQPVLNRKAVGNILLAGAILFTGSNPKKVLRLLSTIGVAVPKPRLFFVIQSALLFPSVYKLWTDQQERLLESSEPLSLAGDGRCDSPGFSAKYLTYTFIDASRDVILHTELVQVNEVGNSVRMELEGLKRGLQFLLDMGKCISNIVTDRHSSIRAYLKREHPDIAHLFDCWHVAKGKHTTTSVYQHVLVLSRKPSNFIALHFRNKEEASGRF